MLKKISLIVLICGYIAAGANHFLNPASYIAIIPQDIPYPKLMNILAGVFEILFGLLLIPRYTRRWAAYGIIAMLTAFLPVHISMVNNAPCRLGTLAVTPVLAWLRLALQPVLMLWVWQTVKHAKTVTTTA